jgi:hypothetical protein
MNKMTLAEYIMAEQPEEVEPEDPEPEPEPEMTEDELADKSKIAEDTEVEG